MQDPDPKQETPVKALIAAFLALPIVAAGVTALALRSVDPGERAYTYCFSCHSVQANQTGTLPGPNLNGIIGRPIAAGPGFDYTPELKAFGEGKVWTPDLILQWLKDPKAMVSGTKMDKPLGPRNDAERSALIGYLKAH